MADTIAAISTAPGEAGIGIVRVSGPGSMDIMNKIMEKRPPEIEPRHMYLAGVVKDSDNPLSETIDQALFAYMQAPASYTGEDMLEIQAHGSAVSLKKILEAVLDTGIGNIRMAEPGEFTKLAFLNGKMDLSQAEAVIDIIQAKSDLSLEIAEAQHEGRLSATVKEIRETLLDILAEMAVGIDYPDEDYEFDDEGANSELVNKLRWVLSDVEDLLDTLRGKAQKDSLRQIDQIDHKMELNAERKKTLTTLMTRGYLEPAIFTQENNEIAAEADALLSEKERLVKEVAGNMHQTDSLNDLIQYVAHAKPGTSFDGDLVGRFVDHVTIRTRTEIVFHLKCGLNLTERIGDK